MLEGFRSRVSGWFGKGSRSGHADATGALMRIGLGNSTPKKGTAELLNAYRNSPWLRAIVKRIADSVASVQFEVGVSTEKSGKTTRSKTLQRMPSGERQRVIPKAIDDGSFEPIEDHPLLDLLYNGNAFMLGQQVRALIQTYLELKGESFVIIQRNKLGKPQSLWPVPPNWVRQTTLASGASGYDITVNGTLMSLPASDVLCIRDPDPSNPYVRGSGIAESLGDEIDTDEYAAEFLKAFFYNGALPDAVIAIEGWKPENVEKFKADWLAEQRGPRKSHQVKFTNGKVSAQVVGHTFKDMEIVELRRFLRDIVVEVFGIPPECVGILENSNRATIDAAMTILMMLVVTPRAQLICDYIQAKLAPEFDDRLVVWFKSPVPEDKTAQLQAMTAAPWAPTRGEWRKAQGLHDRGAVDDVHMQPFSLLEQKPGSSPQPQIPSQASPDAPEKNPKAIKAITKDDRRDISSVLAALNASRLTTELDPIWKSKIQEWGDEALKDLGISVSFDLQNPLVVGYIERFAADHITGKVNETTRDAIRAALAEGVEAGESIRDLSKRVTGVFDAARGYRSVMIARTEVIGASNFATVSAYAQSGVVEKKQLVSTPDENTRDTHAEANGQVVALEAPFIIGGYEAQYPGDDSLPAEEKINCRCTVSAVVGEPKSADVLSAIWKVYDRRAAEWERTAVAALGRGFDAQERDIQAALKSLE